MARPPTGSIVEREGKNGVTYAVRFRAYGDRHYLTLGTSAEGWTYAKAEVELANVLADVRRGIWQPPEPAPVVEAPQAEQTFWEFAAEWYARREAEGLAERTLEDYEWALNKHLCWFAHHRLSEITKQEVDRYKTAKVADGVLSANSINKTLVRLSQILAEAADYDLIPANPAAGRRRRLKGTTPARSWVLPEQLMTLLEASGRNRPLIATLAGTGLRVGEACALEWRDVNLATGALRVRASKTEAGIRTVDLSPALADELRDYRASLRHDVQPTDVVFTTRNGTAQTRNNVNRRALRPAIKKANVKLADAGIEQIGKVTPHGLRRTYASLREACGDPPSYAAKQLGHTDPAFTLRVYAQANEHRERLTGAAKEAYDRAIEWARMGTNAVEAPSPTPDTLTVEAVALASAAG